MERENGFRTVDKISTEEVRKLMIEQGWSPSVLDEIDKISKELTRLQNYENDLREQQIQFMSNKQDVSNIQREAHTIHDTIQHLKEKMSEIEMHERIRLAEEGKL